MGKGAGSPLTTACMYALRRSPRFVMASSASVAVPSSCKAALTTACSKQAKRSDKGLAQLKAGWLTSGLVCKEHLQRGSWHLAPWSAGNPALAMPTPATMKLTGCVGLLVLAQEDQWAALRLPVAPHGRRPYEQRRRHFGGTFRWRMQGRMRHRRMQHGDAPSNSALFRRRGVREDGHDNRAMSACFDVPPGFRHQQFGGQPAASLGGPLKLAPRCNTSEYFPSCLLARRLEKHMLWSCCAPPRKLSIGIS